MSEPSGLHLRAADVPAGAIDALAASVGGRAGASVLDDLHRRGRRSWAPGRAVHRAWTFDRADRRDRRWWPQGVDVDGSVVAVTWYAKKLPGDAGSQGSRVTFLDLETCRYEHALLVQPTLDDGVAGVRPLKVHAGGLAWNDGLLHVAATAKGYWTAALADVVRVPDGEAGAALREAAFGYRYLLPVRTAQRATTDDGVEPLRYSFLSRDGDDLLVGEYATGSRTRRLARVTPAAGGHARPVVLGDGVGHMQGVARRHERWHVTTSHGPWTPGSVWTGAPGSLTRHRWATPMGPEDLTWDPATDLLWSVSEHPHRRWVYAMKPSWFEQDVE
jgi:hypothetical protein